MEEDLIAITMLFFSFQNYIFIFTFFIFTESLILEELSNIIYKIKNTVLCNENFLFN